MRMWLPRASSTVFALSIINHSSKHEANLKFSNNQQSYCLPWNNTPQDMQNWRGSMKVEPQNVDYRVHSVHTLTL